MGTGDNNLIESLLFDAKATRAALTNWMKATRDGSSNMQTSLR